MKQTIDAIYENGLLRPLEPLDLADQERVSLTVESGESTHWIDDDAIDWASREGDLAVPLLEVRARLAKLNASLSESVIAERGE